MRKSLFAIGLLAISYSVQAQILCHVDANANMYVSKGTLVYSGGGLQMKGNGTIENHGNFMVAGTATDVIKTIDASNANKTEANGGGNFVNKLNEPTAYASVNTNNSTATPVYTYGQLFITGIPQSNITGIVDEEFRQIRHGDYQQVSMPFYLKSPSTLNAELGKSFDGARTTKNGMLHWDNARVEFHHLPTLYGIYKFGNAAYSYAYWILGGNNLDVSNVTRTVKGVPFGDQDAAQVSVTLQNAGSAINFGTGGSNKNDYKESYNTYLQDGFELASGGGAWTGNYGKNWYQYGNPFLTNLDLSRIAYNEPAAIGDGVNLSNIYGVRVDVSGVQMNNNGGGSQSYRAITFSAGVPTGAVDYMMIRPFGTFAIKLSNNNNTDVLNFSNLRRFNYYSRDANTNYNVNASRSAVNNKTQGTVKQLGVIALDANGKEVGSTYYVVYANGTTGHSASPTSTQYTASSRDVIGTFEENVAGGYDNNYTAKYWLNINEANENDFLGKNVMLATYSNTIKSLKFEIRENAELVSNGTHQLSSGIGFYYKGANGTVMEAKQGDVVPATGTEYNLYYGAPNSSASARKVASEVTVMPSRTKVVYNPEITNYIVRFDPDWKKADIEVYDMSGKLVISKKAVNTSTDFVIELNNSIKNSYVVKIVSDKGETVSTKILK